MIPRCFVVAGRDHELQNEDDPEAQQVRAWHAPARRASPRHGRDLLGWAILVCRTPTAQS
ncbi:MAG TPA: hypothetical protein VGF10_01040 [Gaiella sp.]